MKTERVAIYGRVSTVAGQHVEMQLSELREYAARRGWQLAGEYVDHVHGLETRSVRREKLTAGIDCTKILALPVHTSKISTLIFLAIKAKKAERKKKLRLDILEKRLELSCKIVGEELQIIRQRDSALDRLFGDEESDTEAKKKFAVHLFSRSRLPPTRPLTAPGATCQVSLPAAR